jgi:hypothetical protein
MTKTLLLATAILFCLCSFRIEQKPFIIQKINLKNQSLLKAIDDYLTEYKDDLEPGGVLVVKIDPAKKYYYITRKMFADEITEWLPSFYSIYKKRVILIYTGFESNIFFEKESSIELFKAANKYFVDPHGFLYEGIVWRITIDNDSYIKEEVNGIPLDY